MRIAWDGIDGSRTPDAAHIWERGMANGGGTLGQLLNLSAGHGDDV